MTAAKPASRPNVPHFSSGPCAKRPGWNAQNLKDAALGRSHRAKVGKAKLKLAIELTREVLEVPAGYRIGIVPASDTGAVEMALWSLLGARPVTTIAWESFGEGWVSDIVKELKLKDVTKLQAGYGEIPDLSKADPASDIVFTWNGTTSGVRVPNADWISADREGLTICDATSAAFAQVLDWPKLDVVTFSWQKALGGEAAHGMLVLSPRAVARLESYKPAWPLPKIFRMTKGGKLNEGIFEGETINTPSMLCVEDYLDALNWGKSVGGLKALIARADANTKVLADWKAKTPWIDFLAKDPAIRSNTSVCLKVVDPAITSLTPDAQADFSKKLVALVEKEGAGYDFAHYRDAPAGLRIWCGATVEASDVALLTQWIDWAFAETKSHARQSGVGSFILIIVMAGLEPAIRRNDRTGGFPARRHASRPGASPVTTSNASFHQRIRSNDKTQSSHLRRAVAGRRADLQGSRHRCRFPAQSRQGQGQARRDHRQLRRAGDPLRHQGDRQDHREGDAAEGDRPRRHRRRQCRNSRRHRQGHHRDEHAVRQFDHDRRTCDHADAGAGAGNSAGRCLDPGRQVGEEPLHGRRDHRQDAGRDRLRQYRFDRRRPRAGPADEGDRVRSVPVAGARQGHRRREGRSRRSLQARRFHHACTRR